MKKTINNAVTTNYEKNLDYIQDNCPELLDDYIELFENSIFSCDEKLNPQDIVDILIMINDLKKEQYKRLN